MSAIKIIQTLAKKSLTKNRGAGIMELPSDMATEAKAGEILALLQKAGIELTQLDNYIRSEKDLVKFLNIIEATNKPTVYSGQAAVDQLNKLFPKKGELFDLKGKKLDPGKPIMGGTQDDTVTGIMTQVDKRMTGINKANKKLGELLEEREIMYGKAPKTKDNPKIQEREMFKDASERFNKTDVVADTVTKIISMEPVAALKEANKIIGRKGIYKNLTKEQSQKILKDTDDWIFQRDPSDLYDYKKNRPFRDDPNFDPDDPDFDPEQGFYTGGMVDVEPSLSDIGHGSDALMARTRLMSPGSQATTSTGLNYLLAEDNDNIRVPFGNGKSVYDRNSFQHKINELKAAFKHYKRGSATGGRQGTMTFEQFAPLFAKENFAEGGRTGFQGGGMGRRAFLKLLATLGGATAAVKSGILGLGGKEATKKAVTETVKQSAGSGTPPPYFFKLVEKIKTLGDDVTEKAATTERQKVTKYKDYELTEDVATGEQTIQKIKTDGPEYYDEQLAEEVYMNYKPGKGLADEGTKGIPADEYIEDTGYLRTSGPDKGELFDSADGLTDDSFKEIMEEIGEVVTKKASGGIAQMIGE